MTRTLTLAIASLATALITSPVVQAQPAVTEDSVSWDCTTMGNGICGPGQGVQPGQYVDGQLVTWGTQPVSPGEAQASPGPWSLSEVPAWCKDICLGA